MNKEEAIKHLTMRMLARELIGDVVTAEALNIAIKALSTQREEKPMSNLINRQDAIDVLNVDAELLRRVLDDAVIVGAEREKCEWELGLIESFISDMRELPSAEPEIIRCKDCKHYQFADNRAFGMPVKMCKWFGFEDVDDDDFCSRAERRAE